MSKRPEKDIAAKLREIREAFGLSQSDMALKLAISEQSYGRYERGEREAPAWLLSSLVESGVSPQWLLAGEGSMFREPSAKSSQEGFSDLPALPLSAEALRERGYVLIPRYDVRAAAGGGAVVEEQNLIGAFAFSREWLHRTLHANPADLLLIEAKGDSMPGIADDGALLLLDKSDPKFRGDGAYVFGVDDLLLVKNLRVLLDGSLEVTSSDEHQSTKDVIARRDLDKVRIVGRVIWKGDRA